MLKNYLTIAWRNLRRNKVISFINVAGLALGMACALLIFLWVDGELSVDRTQPNGDRIFRLEEGDWADLYKRIQQRRGHAKAAVAVARHLAEATFWMLKRNEPYKERKNKPVSSTRKSTRFQHEA